MKKNYILKFFVGLFFLLFQISNGQIISQYVETNSGTTPKGIEIWNNTGSTLDFSTNNLDILKGTNGAAASSDILITSGTLAPGEVMVIGTSDMGTYLTDAGLTEVTFVSESFTFNGDDALVVQYGGATTDMFGLEGSDPGSSWSGSGVETRNQNIRLIDESDSAGGGINAGDTDGWTDPSTRFVTVSTSPSTLPAGLEGFGVAPITTVWDGSSSTDWSTAANWSNGVPTSSSNASIPDVTNAPIIGASTGAETNDLTITETDGLTISSGGSLRVSGASSGNITYNRTIGTTNWYLISSPVVGQDIDAFVSAEGLASGSGDNVGLGDYDNTAPGWTYYQSGASGTGDFTSGEGRAVLLAATGDIAFTGTMNTGDVGVPITTSSNGFNLVGNPYPSYIAANNAADATNNVLKVNDTDNDFLTESTLWFWDQSSGLYDEVNHSSSFFIAPGQGFFVSSNGSNTLSITEAMQSHQGTDSFQRTSTTRPEINVVMTDGTNTRDADIFYIDGTTTGFDNGYDSSIFGGVANEFAIYTHAVANGNGRNLGIQSLPDNNFENMIIPVGINADSGTQITISATSANLPAGINVYLEDKDDNSFTLLNNSSDFTVTLSSSLSGVGRFYLHTSAQALSVDEVNLDNISMYTSSKNNLRIVGVQNGTAQVNMYNILGKQVLNTSFEGNGLNDITLPNLGTGVYIIQLTTETGKLNKKVIIE